LPKIIKPGRLVPSDGVVKIPDAPSPPVPLPEEPLPGEPQTGENQLPGQEAEQQQEEPAAKFQNMLEESAVERANDVAQKILQRTRTEREEILGRAQAEAQRIREEAYRAAYQQALDEKNQEINSCLSEVNQLMVDLKEQQQSFLKQYEEGILTLALNITKKVLGTSIRAHEELMLPLVKDAVSSVKNADWINVQISERLPGLIAQLRKELAQRQDLDKVELTIRDIPEDSCIVTTPDGIIDASVSVQLENLQAQFERKD